MKNDMKNTSQTHSFTMPITTDEENNYSSFSVDLNTNNYNDAKRQELTRKHLERMPYYIPNRRHQKMAVWTDVKEILFPSCDKNCELVLEEMKLILNYPKTEKYMCPCTQTDQLAFLRQFRCVATGTLLVQINKIDDNQILRERVLKRHMSENSTQFCCLPANKSESTGPEEANLTVLKFKKTCIDSQEFLVPAFNTKECLTGNTIHYIPLHILGNNVPNIRKQMVEFCFHIAKSDNPMVRCCSVEEARQITTWQFNRYDGWEGHWRHLTTRDLLVSFESCMHHLKEHCKDINITQTAEGAVTIDLESGEIPGDAKSCKLSQLFPNLCSNYEKQTPKVTVARSNLTDTKNQYKAVLEKKRQRIKSPKENTNVTRNLADSTSTETARSTSTKDVEESAILAGSTSQTASGISETKVAIPYHDTQQQRNTDTTPTPDHIDILQNGEEYPRKQLNASDNSNSHQNGKGDPRNKLRHSDYSKIHHNGKGDPRNKLRTSASCNKMVDDKTLLKYVSFNPFECSIEALNVIRGMSVEEKGSGQRNKATSTAKLGDVKDNVESMSGTKRSGVIILPVVTGAKESAMASKDASEKNNSAGRLNLTSSLHEKKEHCSLRKKTVLIDYMNKKYVQSYKTTTGAKMLKNSSDSTAIMPSIKPSCENKTTVTSNFNDTHPKENSESGKSCATQSFFNHGSSGKINRTDLEVLADLARRLRNTSHKNTSTFEVQTNLQSNKKISFKGDGIIRQNLGMDENDVPSNRMDLPKETVRANELEDTLRAVKNIQNNTGLQVSSVLGNNHDSSVCNDVYPVEICRNVEDAILFGRSVNETKDFIVNSRAGQKDCNSFSPQNRWAKHFLTVSTGQKSEIVYVQQNDPTTTKTQQSGAVQHTEIEKKKQVTENAAFFHDAVLVVPSVEERVTEIRLLKDMNIDHEEVIDQKSSKDTNETIPSGLSLCSQDSCLLSEQLEAGYRADSPLGENVIADTVETEKNKETSEEEYAVNRSAFEPSVPKVSSLATTNKSTKNNAGETLKTKDTDGEIYSESVGNEETKSECLDNPDHNEKKSKKIKKKKKHTKSRRRKQKATKSTSTCSVELDDGDKQQAVRIQNIIEEQTKIYDILTKKEHGLSKSSEKNRKCKCINENELIDIEASFSRGASVSTPTQLLERVEQSDDSGRKKDIRIKRKNKIEVRQDTAEITQESNPTEQAGISAMRTVNPTLEIDISDIRYDVSCDNSEIEMGGLVIHPEFVLPYVLVNGYRYITLADAHKFFAGCTKNCKILRNVLTTEHSLQLTFCTWEQLYVLDMVYSAKGRKVLTGDAMIRLDVLISRYQDLLCALCQRHSNDAKHKCSY